MSEIKDYSQLTVEELQAEQKKIKKQQFFTALLIGIFIGIVIYGLVVNGFDWVYISISGFMIFFLGKGSFKLKQTLVEIDKELNKVTRNNNKPEA
jgi:uncharacterized membrane protein YdbT with pleckstrin-like domain